MDDNTIKISDLDNTEFTADTEPEDTRLMDLLRLAYTGKIYCRTVVLPLDRIIPFSNYMPEISQDYTDYFKQELANGQPKDMLVYQNQDGNFVMSDDYVTYYAYKQSGLTEALCQVLDCKDAPEGALTLSGPYHMELPSQAEIINE